MKKFIAICLSIVFVMTGTLVSVNFANDDTATTNLYPASNIGTKDEFETLNDAHFINSKEGWAVGNLSTILHTTDGGVNWEMQKAPLDATLQSVYFTDSKNGIAVGGINLNAANELYGWNSVTMKETDAQYWNYTYGVIFKTSDGGKTWTAINGKSVKTRLKPKSSHFLGWLYDVKFADKVNGWAVGEFGIILKTTNGGLTWSDIGSDKAATADSFLYGLHCTSKTKLYACGEDGKIFSTTDGGKKWKTVYHIKDFPGGDPTSYFGFSYSEISKQISWRDIFFLPNGKTGWAVSYNATIMKTTDSGKTWKKQSSGFSDKVKNSVDLKSIYFADANNGWAVGQMGKKVLHTTNGGKTWIRQDMPNAEWLYGVFFTDKNNGIALGDFGTIVKTTNAGKMWTYSRHMDLYQNTRAPFLVAHAHADDEAVYFSIPLTKYSYEQKLPTVNLRITRDDRNTSRFGELKWLEKIWASNYLNVNTNRYLDEADTSDWPSEYDDEYPSNPEERRAYKIKLWEGNDKITREIVEIIRTWQPLVIATHDPVYGEYFKADHMATGYYTALAVEAAGDPNKYPELQDELGLSPWQPLKFYELATSHSGLSEASVTSPTIKTMTMKTDNVTLGLNALRCFLSQGFGSSGRKSGTMDYTRIFMDESITAPDDDNGDMFTGIQLIPKVK